VNHMLAQQADMQP